MSDAPRWVDTAAAIESGDFARLAEAANGAIGCIMEVAAERDALAEKVAGLTKENNALRDSLTARIAACENNHVRSPIARWEVDELRRHLAMMEEMLSDAFDCGGEDE